MITFLRSLFNSKIGLIVSFLFIVLVAISFAGADITGSMGSGTGLGGSTVAEVGKHDISTEELSMRVNNQLDVQRRQSPGLDMTNFISAGGFEDTLEQMINVRALEEFARSIGLGVSKRLVDGDIASIPAFNGPNGQFDRTTFLSVLSQRKVTEKQLRDDIAADLYTRQMLVPVAGATRIPASIARPYAALALESRSGLVGFVPSTAMAKGTPPTQAELDAYYKQNVARYTVPERRVIRYATFGKAMLADKAKPTEAEIAAAYKADAAKYGARETRSLTQVILQDQNAARAFEAKVKGGTSFAAAAQQAGLEPAALAEQDRAKLTELASKAVADAAFAAAQGAITAPQRSGLGWHVVRVDSVKAVPARTLESVRGEITETLGKQKLDAALADLAAKIEDSIADGATFDEVVKANGLTAISTPAITAAGIDPDNQAFRPDPAFARFIEPAFEATVDDDPIVETIVQGEQYALSDVERIVPATPRPLAQIRDQVAQAFELERASRQARAIADAIIAKASKGVPLAQAINEAGVKLPAPETIGGRRMELTAGGQRVPPPLALLFSMAEKGAKRLEAPGKQGWFIVYLDKITPGDIASQPQLVAGLQAEMGRVMGQEYVSQFANAAKAELGVKRNAKAAATLKRQLTGTDSVQ
ncbi:peptidylprolyl isomerase [Sphingomonas cavernae]|nr:peptidylprolyl isomerase [Sphingomonas cavernae]